ncbi:MAG TPA: hypothetical protein VLK35_16130 [Methylomirabilota bacterium]|nr:hypothetical protein [Methylomirabilota bacterium]
MQRVKAALVPLAVVVGLLVPAFSLAVGPEVRALLQARWTQVPSREVGGPAFTLPDTNGAPVRLADYMDRVVMIHFWTTY